MIASLSFLLDYEKIEDDSDSDMADSEDEQTANQPQVLLNKEAIYKVGSYIKSSMGIPYIIHICRAIMPALVITVNGL